jgi:hypothetical protein
LRVYRTASTRCHAAIASSCSRSTRCRAHRRAGISQLASRVASKPNEPFSRHSIAILIGAAIADVLPSIGDIVREAQGTAAARWLVVLALCVVLFAFPLSRTKRERGALRH